MQIPRQRLVVELGNVAHARTQRLSQVQLDEPAHRNNPIHISAAQLGPSPAEKAENPRKIHKDP